MDEVEMKDTKYLIIKKSDVDAWEETYCRNKPFVEALSSLLELEVSDGRVIRLQDAFSPPAFDVYASSIDLACELANPGDDRVNGLRGISAYFRQSAEYAWHLRRKLPD